MSENFEQLMDIFREFLAMKTCTEAQKQNRVLDLDKRSVFLFCTLSLWVAMLHVSLCGFEVIKVPAQANFSKSLRLKHTFKSIGLLRAWTINL